MLKNFDISKKNCTFALNFRYTISMQVPEDIRKAFAPDVKEYGGSIEYLGKYQGIDAFYLNYGGDADGDPTIVYLWDGKHVCIPKGVSPVSIVNSLLKD